LITNKVIRLSGADSAASSPFGGSASDTDLASASGTKKGVRMLVVLNNKKSLEGGLFFLERRGYQITVVNRISEAIQNLQKIRPHTILLSWNLKNTDIRKTYKLLTEKFNLLCIVFAEDPSTRTTASLMSSGIPHSLLSPVSGPSIHMRVQALLRAKVTGSIAKKKKEASDAAALERVNASRLPPDLVWERGNDPEGREGTVWEGKSATGDKNRTYYFKGPTPPKFDNEKRRWTTEDGKEDIGSVIMKGPGPSKKYKGRQAGVGSGEAFEIDEALTATESHSANQEGLKSKGYSFETEGVEGQDHEAESGAAAAGTDLESHAGGASSGDLQAGDSLAAPSELDDADFDWEAALNDVTNKELTELEHDLHEAFEEADSQEASDQVKAAAALEAEFNGVSTENGESYGRKEKTVPHYEEGEVAAKSKKLMKLGSESLLYKAIKSTIGKSLPPDQGPTKKVELVSYVYPTLVKCPRFKGILFMASATDREHEELFKDFSKSLSEQLNDAGENGVITLLPRIKIDALPFARFFHEKGDFIIQTPYDGDGLAFAFFGTSQLPKIDESPEPEVLAISLENDITGGEELLFDLFLHLPRNDKFILYMNKGTPLSTKSISKFLGFGIKSVHIRKKEKDLFLAYWARNLLKNNR